MKRASRRDIGPLRARIGRERFDDVEPEDIAAQMPGARITVTGLMRDRRAGVIRIEGNDDGNIEAKPN